MRDTDQNTAQYDVTADAKPGELTLLSLATSVGCGLMVWVAILTTAWLVLFSLGTLFY